MGASRTYSEGRNRKLGGFRCSHRHYRLGADCGLRRSRRRLACRPDEESQAVPARDPAPDGFQPEGIEVGQGTTFYVGSVATGAIYRGNLRTGAGATFIAGGSGRPATGIELDNHNRLFVAGAGSGNAYVYDAKTGALIRTYNFATAPTFINDVVVTKNAAYFTDR